MLALLADEQTAGRLPCSSAALWSGGEGLSPVARTRLEHVFGCPLHNEYGASECLSIGYACREGALHVNADWVILEPVDRDYRPTPVGELSHTVLLTNLANAVQPIIRYDLGDRVRAKVGACACGNPLPAFQLEGRSDDVLTLARARRRRRAARAARAVHGHRGRGAHPSLPDRAAHAGRLALRLTDADRATAGAAPSPRCAPTSTVTGCNTSTRSSNSVNRKRSSAAAKCGRSWRCAPSAPVRYNSPSRRG